jgi:hypothetical protein
VLLLVVHTSRLMLDYETLASRRKEQSALARLMRSAMPERSHVPHISGPSGDPR